MGAHIDLFLKESSAAGQTGFPPFVSWNQGAAQALAAEIRELQDENRQLLDDVDSAADYIHKAGLP